MTTQQPSSEHMKDSMRAPWVAGDFGAIAREIGVPEAEGFVARMGLEPGARVLDIACGTGNVTIPLARRGAMVTGLDMTPRLLEEARARATREGLHIRFDEGFAETLPYPDGSFDVVVSMFGIMFSPFPETVALEMARVEFFARNSGPIQLALGRLDTPRQAALLQDLERLWIDNNLATNGESHTLINNEYLEVLAIGRR